MNINTCAWRRRAMRYFVAAGTACLGGFACAEISQDAPTEPEDFTALTLEELGSLTVPTVYAAARREQQSTQAPAAVSVITREDIRHYGYRTLADILRSVRGFYVNSDRGYGFVGVRGMGRLGDYGGPILILIDGHRLNEPIFDSAFTTQEFPLDVDLIDRVEVIRGPGSALYGNNAFFGVINVVTVRGRQLGGAEVSASAGSLDTYTGRFSYGARSKNGIEALFSGTYLTSEGETRVFYPEFIDVNQGIARELDGEDTGKLFASVSYGDLSLQGLYGRRIRQVPTAPWGSMFNDPRFEFTDERGYLETKYDRTFGDEWNLSLRVSLDYYSYRGITPYNYGDSANPDVVLNRDDAEAWWWGSEFQLSRLLFDRHQVTLGAEWRGDLALHQENHDVDPYFQSIDLTTRDQRLGVYLQDEFNVLTNLTLTIGARYDHTSPQKDDSISPRLALVYDPWRSTTLKLLYGHAYRAPNSYERDYITVDYYPNPDLEPETIRSLEGILEQSIGEHLRWTTSLFYNRIDDWIQQVNESADPDAPAYIFRNTDTAESWGAEFELEGQWSHRLRGRLSYTLAETRDRETGKRLTNSPRHLGKANLAVPLYRELVFASAELQVTSARHTLPGGQVDPFAVVNLTVFAQPIARSLDVSASVYNLFDAEYSDPVGPDFLQAAIPQYGRSFRVKLSYRF